LRAYRFVHLAGLLWALAGCGRFGVELFAAEPSSDAGVAPTPDAGGYRGDAAVDAGGVSVDAGRACPVLCVNEHGAASCSTGACEISCEIGYADCDGMAGNGCETSTTDDVERCGSCELQCTTAQGATACSEGVCLPSCVPGLSGDCDGNTQNGCESTLDDNTSACGSCAVSCMNAHGTVGCVAGLCASACDAGYADCDGNPNNGCETRTETDPSHCGGCADACDTSFQVCAGGACQVSLCPAGQGDCDGVTSDCETDLTGNLEDCGFCDNVCSVSNGSPSCVDSSCAIAACDPGFDDCDGLAASGCEVSLGSDVVHCGGCNEPCSNGHGTTSCMSGTCVPTCSSGWGSCDSNPDNGCETQLGTLTNCNGCGNACPNAMAGATAVCRAGVCGYNCDSLSGVYALRINAQSSWGAKQYVSAGSGQLQFWLRLTLTQSGTTLSGTAALCDQVTPPSNNSLTAESYLLDYPDAIYTPGAPPASFSATLASLAPGAGLTAARTVHLLGTSMSDPLNGTWPSLTTVRNSQVDHDGDGEVGMTSVFVDNSTYNHVPTSGSFVAARASHSYGAQRLRFSLGGALTACTGASGSATVQSFDTRNIGCRLESSADCSSSQYTHVDDNATVYSVGSATYSMTKLGNPGSTFSCAQVRSAL